MIAVVAPDSFRRKAAVTQFRHLADGDRGLEGAHRGSDVEQHAQSAEVSHHGIAGEAHPRFLARTLAHERRLPVSGRLVGLIAASPPLEVRTSIAGSGPLLVVLRAEALHQSQRFNQRAIDAEMVAQDPAVRPRQGHDFGEERIGHIVLQHARPDIAVHQGIEHLLIERQVHKTAEHQVGLQSRAEQSIRPQQRLQHLSLQQRLRRNRGRPAPRVHPIEMLVHRPQRPAAHPLDRPDRMIRRDQHLNVDQTHKTGPTG